MLPPSVPHITPLTLQLDGWGGGEAHPSCQGPLQTVSQDKPWPSGQRAEKHSPVILKPEPDLSLTFSITILPLFFLSQNKSLKTHLTWASLFQQKNDDCNDPCSVRYSGRCVPTCASRPLRWPMLMLPTSVLGLDIIPWLMPRWDRVKVAVVVVVPAPCVAPLVQAGPRRGPFALLSAAAAFGMWPSLFSYMQLPDNRCVRGWAVEFTLPGVCEECESVRWWKLCDSCRCCCHSEGSWGWSSTEVCCEPEWFRE